MTNPGIPLVGLEEYRNEIKASTRNVRYHLLSLAVDILKDAANEMKHNSTTQARWESVTGLIMDTATKKDNNSNGLSLRYLAKIRTPPNKTIRAAMK